MPAYQTQELAPETWSDFERLFSRGHGCDFCWCQYGPCDELNARLGTPPAAGTQRLWRVTCFVVDPRHRRKGIAGLALRAALESIQRRGGGLVEAYPVAIWSHGPDVSTRAIYVQGVGPVGPAHGVLGAAGTQVMMRKAVPGTDVRAHLAATPAMTLGDLRGRPTQ